MKNTKRTAVVFIVALLVVCTACLTLTACNKTKHDPEKDPFIMSISTPDGVFNPFFSTSAYDSNIISLTQIGMLGSDKNGKPVYGENEPCVVKDMTQTVNEKGNTVYEFLIKNGIKFSDGVPLTIKDVLFNLYVYLDPAYTGSATIYSTDIVGLQQYRMQTTNEDISDSDVSEFEAQFIAAASRRIDEDIDYVKVYGRGIPTSQKPELPDDLDEDRVILDYARIAKAFYEELITDWNNINVSDYDWRRPGQSYEYNGQLLTYGECEQYLFKEKWQIFFLSDAGYTDLLVRDYEGGPYSKIDGNTLMDEKVAEDIFIREILPTLVEKGLAVQNGDSYSYTGSGKEFEEKLDETMKDICVSSVFVANISSEFPMKVITDKRDVFKLNDDEVAAVRTSIANTMATNFESVAKYWGTASTILEAFKAEAKSDEFAKGDRLVKSIRGITTHKTSNFNGVNYGNEQFDVLSIEIKGIDPKAIYNFSFGVAPMHIYSTTSWDNGKGNGAKNYIEAFDPEKGEFGLEFGNSMFMTEVINASSKIGLPVGAGPYMASSENGGKATSDTFFNLNIVYYERNPYFYTVGEGINNANIKFVRYKVVETDQIINSLITGEIHFGEPNATQPNLTAVKNAGLEQSLVNTNGYGYVGINPRFVPDISVRRAIMKAMNAQIIKDNYYQGSLCEIIKRPMSTSNWAYPKGAGVYVFDEGTFESGSPMDYSYDSTGYDIEQLVIDAGYTKNGDGIYHKNIPGFGDDVLDYKFTIAGGSTDHPAYAMFLQAKDILNRVGFNVKVVTSQTALTDLTAGKLEVWAAAWSSTPDPDMFQVYHMDSQASSTKNWGYAQILGGTNADAWGDELEIVVKLSEAIDKGRSYLEDDDRKPYYSEALDLVMELAVEFPTYQRKDLSAYQANLLDPSTLTPAGEITPYNGLLARLWEVNYVK